MATKKTKGNIFFWPQGQPWQHGCSSSWPQWARCRMETCSLARTRHLCHPESGWFLCHAFQVWKQLKEVLFFEFFGWDFNAFHLHVIFTILYHMSYVILISYPITSSYHYIYHIEYLHKLLHECHVINPVQGSRCSISHSSSQQTIK